MSKTIIAAITLAFATSASALTANEEAYVKAGINALRADCLTNAVDFKIASDVRVHKIRDYGNVITAPVCADYVYTDFVKRRNEFFKQDPKNKAQWEKGFREYMKQKGWK